MFCYSVMLPLSTNLGSLGITTPWLAAWLPLMMSCLLGFGLIRLKERLV
jgi:lipopolysaccharide export LptBFGC system permease protein LptF